MRQPYCIDITFTRARRAYRVEIHSEDSGAHTIAAGWFHSPFTADDRDKIVATIYELEKSTRLEGDEKLLRRQEQLATIYGPTGQKLYAALTQTASVRRAMQLALDSAARQARPLMLRFTFGPGTRELANIPWETLHTNDAPLPLLLAGSRGCCARLFRSRDVGHPMPQPVDSLHVLLVVPSSGISASDRRRQHAAVRQAIEPYGRVSLYDIEPPVTLAKMSALVEAMRPHVISFFGHGGYDEANQLGWLAFDAENRGSEKVSATDVAVAMVRGADPPHLVLLNACESATVSAAGASYGTAATLIQNGIPAVVAMLFPIRIPAAQAYQAHVLGQLGRGQPIENAVISAHAALYIGEPDAASWVVPTLMLRSSDNASYRVFIPPRGSEAEPYTRRTPTRIVGRADVLKYAQGHLRQAGRVALTGEPGMGKAALAAELLRDFDADHRLFVHRGSDCEGLINSLAAWLELRGRPSTRDALAFQPAERQQPGVARQLLILLCNELAELGSTRRIAVCLNGVALRDEPLEQHQDDLTFFVRKLWERSSAHGLHIVLTAAHLPPHFKPVIAVLGIDGLAARTLVPAKLVPEEEAFRHLVEHAGGSPALLLAAAEVLRNSPALAASPAAIWQTSDMHSFVSKHFDRQVQPFERLILQLLAVLDQGSDKGSDIAALEVLVPRAAQVLQHSRGAIPEVALDGAAAVKPALDALIRSHCVHEWYAASGIRLFQLPIYLRAFYHAAPMTEHDRRALHTIAGEYYAAEMPGEAQRAVRHLVLGGHQTRAADVIIRLPARTWAEALALRVALGEYDQVTPLDGLGIAQQARFCARRADAAAAFGDYNAALSWYNQAFQTGVGLSWAERAMLCERISLCLLYTGSGPRALEAAQEGLMLLASEPPDAYEGLALVRREAMIKGRSGARKEAIALLQSVIESIDSASQPDERWVSLKGNALYSLGINYRSIDPARAQRALENSLAIHEAFHNENYQFTTLVEIGNVLIYLGNPIDALKRFAQAEAIAAKYRGIELIRAQDEGDRLVNKSVALKELARTSEAEQALLKALALYKEYGSSRDRADCLYRLGELAVVQGQSQQALLYGKEALVQAAQSDDAPIYTSCASRVLAGAHRLAGDLGLAHEQLVLAAQAQDDLESDDLALLREEQARVALARGLVSEARERVNEALNSAGENSSVVLIGRLESLCNDIAAAAST